MITMTFTKSKLMRTSKLSFFSNSRKKHTHTHIVTLRNVYACLRNNTIITESDE